MIPASQIPIMPSIPPMSMMPASQIPSLRPNSIIPVSQLPSLSSPMMYSQSPSASKIPSILPNKLNSASPTMILTSQLPSMIPNNNSPISQKNNLANSQQSESKKILPYIINGIYLIPRFKHLKLQSPYFNSKNDYFVTQFTPNYRFVIVILFLQSTKFTNLTAISYNIHVRYQHDTSKTTDVGFQLRNNALMKNAVWKSYENHTFNSFYYKFPTPIPLNTKYTDSFVSGQSVQFKIFNNNSSKIYLTNLKIYGY
jgi:hypothetical protein